MEFTIIAVASVRLQKREEGRLSKETKYATAINRDLTIRRVQI